MVRQRSGRPPKPTGEVRSERLVSFVTADEFDNLIRLADAKGSSVSAVIHEFLSVALSAEKRDGLTE